MWFGTHDCVNRYDGRGVKVYRTNPVDPRTISSDDFIRAIGEDRNGNLWIGTQNGLNRYLPEKDAFERFVSNKNITSSISDNKVFCMFTDRKGGVWFGTSMGLNLLENPSSRKFRKFYKKDGLAGNSIYCIFEDRDGNIWVGTTEGLSRMYVKNGRYEISSFFHQVGDPGSISGNSIKAIVADPMGRLWIGTETDGLNLFVPESHSFVHFRYNVLNPNGLSNDNIRKIISGRNGKLWVATMNGMNILDPKTFCFEVYRNDPENRKSLKDNSIKDIYEDDCGSVWMGTMFGGVNVVHPGSIPFTTYRYSKYRNSISSDMISVIAPDGLGNLWIGTEGQGLNYFNVKTGLFKKYIHNPLDLSSLGHNTIKAIYRDSIGRIWIGLYEGGLDLFVPSTGKFEHYPPHPGQPNALTEGYVTSISGWSAGRLLVGTVSKGLYVFDPKDQAFRRIEELLGKGQKLCNSYISVVYSDSKGNLWVGTLGGLNMLSNGTRQLRILFKGNESKSSHQAVRITSIREDRYGNIWIGTLRDGLSLYHPKTHSFTTYFHKDGLASDNVTNLLDDDEGNLWISSDKGLTKFDHRQRSFKTYNTSDGLPSNEFNLNSAYKDMNGRLYFGSFNGLVTFTPKDISENRALPQMTFTGLKLFNKPVAIGGPDKILTNDINFSKSITFDADQNIFTIDFAALSYIQSQRNKYAYKLEGLEEDWNYVDIPSATYTNLSPGKYKFLIKGSNNDGLWNNKPAVLEINILPPLWRTWWAYLLYFTAGSTVLFLVLRFTRRQQQLKSQLYYEHLNNERQQELYQMKLDFFTRISHEIRTPLTLIFAPLEKLKRYAQDNHPVQSSIVGIKRNTERLLRLVGELLDFRKIESGNVRLQVAENDLVAFCRNIYNTFKGLAEMKDIDYCFKSEAEQVFIFYDAGQMEKVFNNILSNAFKYTPDGGKITFSLTVHDGYANVTITDNGIGIPEEARDKIFTNFYQVRSGQSAVEGWGIGLALVKNIVELHKGEISIMSEQAIGDKNGSTRVNLLLRPGRDHFTEDEFAENSDIGMTVVNIPEPDDHSSVGLVARTVPEQRHTVLVVEDNDELRAFIMQSLEASYHIIEGADGLEGWEVAVTNIPDIIVSDVSMPKLGGLELCQKLKQEERTSHIPVIMLTAMASHMHQADGLEAGADVYITKPFSIRVLELSIRNLLQVREDLKQRYIKQIMLTPRKLEIESPDERFLSKLMQVIEDNMEDPEFSVLGLVDRIGMSRTVLYRKIKSLTDLSITDFIKSQRLKRAEQLLSENKLNVADVAYSVGFNDRRYFSKEFRKQFGYPPSKYNTKTD